MRSWFGTTPDAVINLHTFNTMQALVTAIALAEDGRLPWTATTRAIGVTLALVKSLPNARLITPPTPMHNPAMDALSTASLADAHAVRNW